MSSSASAVVVVGRHAAVGAAGQRPGALHFALRVDRAAGEQRVAQLDGR